MATKQETTERSSTWLGIGAVLAAIGASACCVGPLLLFIAWYWWSMDEQLNFYGNNTSIVFHNYLDFYWFELSQTLFNA